MKFTMYHACITVLDLEKSMKFYEEALGLQKSEESKRLTAPPKSCSWAARALPPAGTDLVRGSQGTL